MLNDKLGVILQLIALFIINYNNIILSPINQNCLNNTIKQVLITYEDIIQWSPWVET